MRLDQRCHKCGGRRDYIVYKKYVRWICWGCRILKRCDAPGPNDCWIWQGATRGDYGVIRYRSGKQSLFRNVHRVAWVAWIEDLPPSHDVIHAGCRVKLCCNPKHLALRKTSTELTANEVIPSTVG